jgi:hypothetical protein
VPASRSGRRRRERDARQPADAAVGIEAARALEVHDRRRGGGAERAVGRAGEYARALEQALQPDHVGALRLGAEGGPEPLEVAPEDVRVPEPHAVERAGATRTDSPPSTSVTPASSMPVSAA